MVFADEPTGNLDSKASGEVLALLRHAVDDFGQTVVMVTHDAHAASFADRLIVLADGRIVHDGEALERRGGARPDEGRSADGRRRAARLCSRKLRALLTGIAIALGVALMAGTYILTDTINQPFAAIFATATRTRPVVVTPHRSARARTPRSPTALDRRSDARAGARGARRRGRLRRDLLDRARCSTRTASG